jgi:hypothetical protein
MEVMMVSVRRVEGEIVVREEDAAVAVTVEAEVTVEGAGVTVKAETEILNKSTQVPISISIFLSHEVEVHHSN